MIGGVVRREVDLSAAAGTNLTALVNGLTFSVEQDYGAVFEINASGQIEVTNDGSGNGSQHILKCDYVPPVSNYQVYSNHPAGSTVSGRTSVATVIYKDSVNGYDTVSFSGNSNQWRQVRLDSSANNVVVGFSDQDTNPEVASADLLIEVLASNKFTATVGGAQLSGANNISTTVTNGSKFIGLGVYGNSVGCYLGSFGVKWRQILAVDNRWSNDGDTVTVSCQGVGASGAIVTLNSERDGSGTSVAQSVTSQSDSSISYTVNQGALTTGQVYLFVESNGDKTTDGFEINIGLAQPGTSGFLVENLVSQGAVTTNLSQMGTNTSGIIEFGNGRIGIVDNGNAEVHEYDLADLSTRLRIITLGGLNTTENDSEDGCWMGNGEFGIVCEDNSNYFIHVFDYPDVALGDVTAPAKETHTVAVPGGDNNSGGEMLSYNPKTRTWYLGGEGEQANTLQKFYKIIRPLSEHTNFDYNDAELVVTEPFDAELLVGDLSGGFFHEASGTVVLCSHTASNLKQLDPEGDGTVISTKVLSPTGNQWEAAVNLGGGDDVQAISEGNVTERFDYPAATEEKSGSSSLTAVSEISATATKTSLGSSALSIAAAIAVVGLSTHFGSTNLSSSANLVSLGVKEIASVSTLSVTSDVVASGIKSAYGSSSLSSIALISSSGSITELASGSSNLNSESTIASTGNKTSFGSSALSAISDIQSVGNGTGVVTGSSGIAGISNLAAVGLKISSDSGSLSASGGIDASVLKSAFGSAFLSGISSIQAVGESSSLVNGASLLTAVSNINSNGVKVVNGSSELSALAEIQNAGIKVSSVDGVSSLSANGIVFSSGLKESFGLAVISSVSDISAVGLTSVMKNIDPELVQIESGNVGYKVSSNTNLFNIG